MKTWGHTTRQPNPDPNEIYSTTPVEYFIGKFVQLCFTYGCGKHYEYMWVKVTGLSDTECELEGVLDNDPVHVTDYTCGSGVGFDRTEIEKIHDD